MVAKGVCEQEDGKVGKERAAAALMASRRARWEAVQRRAFEGEEEEEEEYGEEGDDGDWEDDEEEEWEVDLRGDGERHGGGMKRERKAPPDVLPQVCVCGVVVVHEGRLPTIYYMYSKGAEAHPQYPLRTHTYDRAGATTASASSFPPSRTRSARWVSSWGTRRPFTR